MIKKETIDKLIALSIVDVVSDSITLQKAGANYKACCPFHKEKTGSFVVSPHKNIYHCFGCGRGGNTISFVMENEGVSFNDACKRLGEKYNIPILEDKKEEKTDEERALDDKRESAYIIMEHVQRHYRENLYRNTPEAKAALSYAVARWGKETVEELGLGYATPDWKDIIKFAEEDGLNVQLMKEMDLIRTSEKGNDYGFFNDRLMIPIRDKYGRILSYTARTMDEHKEKGSKYINGSENLIYSKGRCFFGMDTAQREASKKELFYIVEGAPDVIKMQSIGVYNTIAPLGTALTKEQLESIKRFHAKLCFIPDADNAGIQAVMKNGKIAIERGFKCIVKEIPPIVDEEGHNIKQDADSYFQRANQVEELKSEDFVIWYARHTYDENLTDTAKSERVRNICDILTLEKDQYVQDSLLEALGQTYGHKNLWRNALNDAKRRKSEEKAQQTSKKSGIDLQKYGFYEQHNSYWQNEKQWSNFKMKPLYHILGINDSRRLYEITNVDGVQRTIELTAEELVSLPKFMVKVESVGNFLWYAKSEELMKLKKYLYDITGTALRITQYGWQSKGFWAFGNGCILENEWIPADEMGIVHLHEEDSTMDNYYLEGASNIYAEEKSYFGFERQFIYPEGHSSITMGKLCNMMQEVFGDNAKVAVCYLLSSLFRDLITSYTTNFPILNLFGPKGSGKSELGITLSRFFTIGEKPINLRNATFISLSQTLSQAANSIVHLDEYKNSLDMRIIEIIKGVYDGVGRMRMDMDMGKKIEKTPVECGVVLSGQEMPTLDIAMFSRMIFLTNDTTVHDREAKDKFNRLCDVRKMGLQHLTRQILSHRKLFENSFYDTYNEVTNEIYDQIENLQIEDRLWRNWVILLSSYKILYKVLGIPWDYEELKNIFIEGIKRQNSEVISNNELGNLWNSMIYLYEEGMINYDVDFKVKYLKKLKTDKVEKEYKSEVPVLMIRLNHFIGQYRKMAKQQDERVMSRDSIKYYLTTSSAYLGGKASERWKVYQDGRPVIDIEVNPKTGASMSKERAKFDRCMCFDYNLLKEKFDLNLETVSSDIADARENTEIAEEEQHFKDKKEPKLDM